MVRKKNLYLKNMVILKFYLKKKKKKKKLRPLLPPFKSWSNYLLSLA